MSDRRKGDRRAPEEGVVKIKTKSLAVYIIVTLFLVLSVVLNIILIVMFINKKSENESFSNSISNNSVTNESIYENMYNCDLKIVGNKKEIKKGETITYDIKAENINAGTGIIMFESLLDYDSDLFECDILIDENSEWSKVSLIENYFTLTRKDLLPSSKNQSIAKLSVKAKDNAELGEYTINLIDSKFTMESDESFVVPNNTINLEIN